MSHGFQDWRELGVWPLQDHQDGVKATRRRQMVGGRLVKMVDPSVDTAAAHAEYAREGPQGTIGDIHPWLFWQTAGKDRRGTGSWSQAFAGLTGDAQSSGGGPITGPPTAGVQPVRTSSWESDLRYGGKQPGWPSGFPRLPKGTVVAVMPAMEETRQVELTLHADPRIIAPNIDGPGEAGTLVCDLQPNLEPCMDNSTVPGLGGRHARIQSMMRVVAFSPGGGGGTLSSPGNAIAWNLARSGTEGLLGCGAVWIRAIGGGPITPGGSSGGPITPGGGVVPGPITPGGSVSNLLLDAGGDPPPMEGEILPANLDGAEHIGKKPNQYGRFSARPGGNHVVAFMANAEGFGPICGGSMADKHTHGRDRDGNPMVAAHISTNAYVFDDADRDGPYLFEGKYPNPGPLPLMSRVHLTWDGALQHPFAGGTRMGKWRWWAEVPIVTPGGGEPPTPNTPQTPRPGGPTTGGPGNPGNPTPGGPTTPGGPRGPSAPSPPNPSGGGVPGPITPNPMGPMGPRFPGYPTTGGGGGPSGPSPRVPRAGGGSFPVGGSSGSPGAPGAAPPSGPSSPSGPITPGSGGGPSAPEPRRPGEIPPDPYDPFRDWPQRFADNPESEEPFFDGSAPPGVIPTVGVTSKGDVAAYSIHHPMMETFAAVAFRPQRWARGFANFEHNPSLPGWFYRGEEAVRPQVLAMRAWGAQGDDGEFVYTRTPEFSRARGGTTDGGLLFSPPEFEMEDYIGLGDADVDDPATTSYVTAAPGVVFALGTPVLDGGLAAAGVVITRNTDANRTLLVQQLASDRVATTLLSGWVDQSTDEVGVAVHGSQALRIPRGNDATRPASPVGGEIRVNTQGANDVLEFWDQQGTTWTPAASGGLGGAPTGAEYIVGALNGSLSAERAVTATATISWDLSTGSQAKANVVASSIGNAQLRDGAALSVVGRSANSTGALADIAAGADELVLRRSGTTLGFGTLTNGAFADNTIALARLAVAGAGGYIGSTAGGSAWQEIGRDTPSTDTITTSHVLHLFDPSTGDIVRCTVQDILDLVAP